MEGMIQVANAYYQRYNDEEKREAQGSFNKLDIDGDGKISMADFRKLFPTSDKAAVDRFFQRIDANGDGFLNFSEFLVLYCGFEGEWFVICDGCSASLYGVVYFTCELCLVKGNATFDLCCDCYSKGVVAHPHSPKTMLDCHRVRGLLKRRVAEEEKSPRKREMEELRKIAMAYFQAGSPKLQALARDFFASMDTDGNERVDLWEFMAFMKQEGQMLMRNSQFFSELSQDGKTLDFEDVMTLYYIIKGQRPFCDGCSNFIPGTFFSCVECFAQPGSSFDLCTDCYTSHNGHHSHGGKVAQFLDNYSMLHIKVVGKQQQTETSSTENTPNQNNAIIVAQPQSISKWVKVAFQALDLGVNFANALGCTIM